MLLDRTHWPVLTLLVAVAVAPVLGECPPQQRARLAASDAGPSDYFGISAAICADTTVVGAYGDDDDDLGWTDSGSAYVFVRSGGDWTQQAKLTAPNPTDFDYFGYSVAVDGDTVVIGAYQTDVGNAINAGAAYVFVHSGGVWMQEAMLVASDADEDDWFGFSVAVAGDTAVVGAHQQDRQGKTDAGAAYVFVRSGNVWTQQGRLTASDAVAYDYFGRSVAASGNTVLIGAPGVDLPGADTAGAAYVFVRSGSIWAEQAKLSASDAAAYDNLGFSVTLNGDTAVIGAIYDDNGGGSNAGSAYVFVRSGALWAQQAKLTASDAAGSDIFGRSVAVAGDTAVIGANQDDHAGGMDAGSAYVFVRSGTAWTQEAKLVAADPAASDFFGSSVAVYGSTVAVGAPYSDQPGVSDAGAAYVFTLGCGPGDFDADGDVDLTDFAHLQSCFSGLNQSYPPGECADADFEPDGDVDISDFAVFGSCLNGPDRPAADGCPQNP